MIRFVVLWCISFLGMTSFIGDNQIRPKKVIFFGDSITELGVNENGFIDLLNKKLILDNNQGKYTLIGAGIGGNKVYDLHYRMEKDVMSQFPDIVVLWIGVNDVWHKTSFGIAQNIPPTPCCGI